METELERKQRVAKLIQEEGELPLHKLHVCFDKGHALHEIYKMDNGYSEWGMRKCTRCGWEYNWQYDKIV